MSSIIRGTLFTASTSARTCDLRNDFMKSLSGPLQPHEMEYGVDILDTSKLNEYQDFDTQDIMDSLIDHACAFNTSPDDFHREIRELIFLRKLKNNRKVATQSQDTTLLRLEMKYNICTDQLEVAPQTVTHVKLTFLFPHFSIPNMMPFSSSPSYFQYSLSRILIYHEFGGLIPKIGSLEHEVRKIIICLHLWCLTKVNGTLHLRTHCVMLKKRMNKSPLSDDRKIRYLQLNNILQDNKALADKLRDVFIGKISPEFTRSVFWSLIE